MQDFKGQLIDLVTTYTSVSADDQDGAFDLGYVYVTVQPEKYMSLTLTRKFIALTNANVEGSFENCMVLDNQEHSYIEIGAWIGSQAIAFRYMALGVKLKVFQLLTPMSVLGLSRNSEAAKTMMGIGMVSVQSFAGKPL